MNNCIAGPMDVPVFFDNVESRFYFGPSSNCSLKSLSAKDVEHMMDKAWYFPIDIVKWRDKVIHRRQLDTSPDAFEIIQLSTPGPLNISEFKSMRSREKKVALLNEYTKNTLNDDGVNILELFQARRVFVKPDYSINPYFTHRMWIKRNPFLIARLKHTIERMFALKRTLFFRFYTQLPDLALTLDEFTDKRIQNSIETHDYPEPKRVADLQQRVPAIPYTNDLYIAYWGLVPCYFMFSAQTLISSEICDYTIVVNDSTLTGVRGHFSHSLQKIFNQQQELLGLVHIVQFSLAGQQVLDLWRVTRCRYRNYCDSKLFNGDNVTIRRRHSNRFTQLACPFGFVDRCNKFPGDLVRDIFFQRI